MANDDAVPTAAPHELTYRIGWEVIADATGVESRARGMALIGAAFGAGFPFGPILGSLAVMREPAGSGGEYVQALPGFLASGLSLLAFIVATVKLPESLRKNAPSSVRHSWLNIAAIREAMRVPSIGALLAMFFVATFAFTQFEVTLSLLTRDALNLSARQNFYLFTYLGVMLCLVQGLLVRSLVPRAGEVRLIIIGIVLMGAGLWLTSLVAEHRSVTGLILIIPLLVCGFSFVTPSSQALISRRSDPRRQGEIMGVNQSASAMARILGPVIGNVLFGFHIELPYKAGALLLLPAFLLAVSSIRTGADYKSAVDVSAN